MNSRYLADDAGLASLRAPMLCIVVPFYNELAVLPTCHERLTRVLDVMDVTYEIIFVDDGSTDGSAGFLAQLIRSQPHLKLVRLSRNFGKEAAMAAGLNEANGAATIILDADLQDPPELIPDMVAAWQAGVDVVCMRRRTRAGESWHKRLTAFLYYRLLNRISGVHIPPDTGDFRLLSRRAVHALLRLPERSRYMKGLFAWIGLPTTVLEYDRAPRAAGTTKWGYGALVGLAIEGITSFSVKPLRWASLAGVTAAAFGLVYGLAIVLRTALFGDPVQGYASLMAVMTFLGGIQLITVGLLGEYVGKAYMEAKQRPLYLVRDVVRSAYAENTAQHKEAADAWL